MSRCKACNAVIQSGRVAKRSVLGDDGVRYEVEEDLCARCQDKTYEWNDWGFLDESSTENSGYGDATASIEEYLRYRRGYEDID